MRSFSFSYSTCPGSGARNPVICSSSNPWHPSRTAVRNPQVSASKGVKLSLGALAHGLLPLRWQDASLTLPWLYVCCSGMGIPPPQPAAHATAAVDASALTAALQATMRAGPAAPAGPALEDVLTPDALLPLLQSPDMLSRLAPHMPEEQRCAVCTSSLMMASSSPRDTGLSDSC